MIHKKLKICMSASDTGELNGQKSCDGCFNSLPRLYKFIYNVVKIIWSKTITFLFFKFFPISIF